MTSRLNVERLSALLKAKRGKRGLREVAAEIEGVSASTLSRIEQGKVPDLDTFLRLSEWLGVSPAELAPTLESSQAGSNTTQSVPQAIEVHLRADKVLSPETVDALVTMVRLAYDAAKNTNDSP